MNPLVEQFAIGKHVSGEICLLGLIGYAQLKWFDYDESTDYITADYLSEQLSEIYGGVWYVDIMEAGNGHDSADCYKIPPELRHRYKESQETPNH